MDDVISHHPHPFTSPPTRLTFQNAVRVKQHRVAVAIRSTLYFCDYVSLLPIKQQLSPQRKHRHDLLFVPRKRHTKPSSPPIFFSGFRSKQTTSALVPFQVSFFKQTPHMSAAETPLGFGGDNGLGATVGLCLWSRIHATAQLLLLGSETPTPLPPSCSIQPSQLHARREFWRSRVPIYAWVSTHNHSLRQGDSNSKQLTFLTPFHVLQSAAEQQQQPPTAASNRAIAQSIANRTNQHTSSEQQQQFSSASSPFIQSGRVMGLVGVEVVRAVRIAGASLTSLRQQDVVLLVRDPFQENPQRRSHDNNNQGHHHRPAPSTMLLCVHGDSVEYCPSLVVPGTGLLLDTPTALPLSSTLSQELNPSVGGVGGSAPSHHRHLFLIACPRNILAVLEGSGSPQPDHSLQLNHHANDQPRTNGAQTADPDSAASRASHHRSDGRHLGYQADIIGHSHNALPGRFEGVVVEDIQGRPVRLHGDRFSSNPNSNIGFGNNDNNSHMNAAPPLRYAEDEEPHPVSSLGDKRPREVSTSATLNTSHTAQYQNHTHHAPDTAEMFERRGTLPYPAPHAGCASVVAAHRPTSVTNFDGSNANTNASPLGDLEFPDEDDEQMW